jgi:hypothetical protein
MAGMAPGHTSMKEDLIAGGVVAHAVTPASASRSEAARCDLIIVLPLKFLSSRSGQTDRVHVEFQLGGRLESAFFRAYEAAEMPTNSLLE